VPPEQSTPPATATTRRSFLTRTAGLGALATITTAVSPAHSLVDAAAAAGAASAAGSRRVQASTDQVSDADFAAFTAPLELAAVLAYQAALDSSAVGAASSMIQTFQDHHQTVAETLTTLIAADADPPLPATAFSDPIASSIQFAGAEPDVLRSLAAMENTLSATHLLALETLAEPVTAKVVAQVLATEAQQATALANTAGEDLNTITPAVATTASALQPGDVAGAPPQAETTSSDGTDSGSGGSNGTSSGSGNQGGTGTGGNDSGGSSSDSNSGGGSTDSGSGSGGSGSGGGGGASGGDSGSGGSGSGSGDSGSGSGDSGSSSGGPTGSGSTSGT